MHIDELIKTLEDIRLYKDVTSVIGQYKDSNGTWPMGSIEVAKVPGNNQMAVLQIILHPPKED